MQKKAVEGTSQWARRITRSALHLVETVRKSYRVSTARNQENCIKNSFVALSVFRSWRPTALLCMQGTSWPNSFSLQHCLAKDFWKLSIGSDRNILLYVSLIPRVSPKRSLLLLIINSLDNIKLIFQPIALFDRPKDVNACLYSRCNM